MELIVVILAKIFKELRAIREELVVRNLYDLGGIDKQNYFEVLKSEASGLKKENEQNG